MRSAIKDSPRLSSNGRQTLQRDLQEVPGHGLTRPEEPIVDLSSTNGRRPAGALIVAKEGVIVWRMRVKHSVEPCRWVESLMLERGLRWGGHATKALGEVT